MHKVVSRVAGPIISMTLGNTFFKCHICLLQLVTITVSQKERMLLLSSCYVLGFISLLKYSLASCQRFSMGLQSGLSAVDFHQLILFSSMKLLPNLDVCFRSLFCVNQWPSGYSTVMKGFKVTSRMFTNIRAFIFPSNMHTLVISRQLMPALIWGVLLCVTVVNVIIIQYYKQIYLWTWTNLKSFIVM